ncbi:MAG TPA: hypothetical protein VMF89_08820, partial [Polyangiales bacterium]|nr:hypothetical protein [Polyangiales bacterium]
SKLQSGECAERDPLGPCNQFREFGPGSKAMLGVGAPVLALGLALITTSAVQSVRHKKDWKATVAAGAGVFGVVVGRAL